MIKEFQTTHLHGSYDEVVDVLHLAVGLQANVEGEDVGSGIELDYDVEDGRPCGITVIGYYRNKWPDNMERLTSIVANHFSLPAAGLAEIINGFVAGILE